MDLNKIIKSAFTMSEVLLTLIILGIIAVFMLKSISRINPDKDRVVFIRSFHAIEKAAGEAANDSSFYDTDSAEGSDFTSTPLPNARVYIDDGATGGTTYCPSQSPYSNCNKTLTVKNAPCYFIAERLNIVGSVNCSSTASIDTKNFQMGNGACIYGLSGRTTTLDFVISPSCEGVEKGYAVTLYPSGNLTVPEATSTYSSKFTKKEIQQKRAYQWMKEQTDVKKKKYDFEKNKK